MARHRRTLRPLIALFLVASFGLVSLTNAHADDLSGKRQQRAAVANQIAQLKAAIASDQNQELALQQAIAAMEQRVLANEQAIAAGEIQLAAIRASIIKAQQHLAEVQAEIRRDQGDLGREMRVSYQLQNSAPTVDSVLTAGDLASAMHDVEGAARITHFEDDLVARVQDDELEAAKTVVSVNGQEQAEEGVLQDLDARHTDLVNTEDAEQQALALLAQVKADDQKRLEDAQAAEAQLDAQIAQLEAEQAAAAMYGGGNGQFSWPESGEITQGFGCTPYPFEMYDAACPSRHFHSGLDIAAPCGTPIHAASAGIVHEYVSWGGYGHYIIGIDGNGWSNVYGHMEGFAVPDGAVVSRGQVIGYEGSTGNSTGCHVHFEVRYNNQYRNPLNYLS